MKKKTCCCFLALLFPILIVTAGSSEAGEPVYSLTVNWTKSGRKPVISEIPDCALEQRGVVTVPIALSTLVSSPFWIGEFDFEIEHRLVLVEIADPSKSEPAKNGTPVPLEILQAEFVFEWGKEVPILKSPTGTLSFTVTPSPVKPEREGETAAVDRTLPAGEVEKLEVSFRTDGGHGNIHVELYNPTSRKIEELHVRATAEKKGDFEGIDRVYKERISCEPLSAEREQIDAKLPQLPEGVKYEFKLEKVFGKKFR